MIVYALYDVYYDGCNVWEIIIDLYANEDDAIMAQIKLEQSNKETGQSYNVCAMTVK